MNLFNDSDFFYTEDRQPQRESGLFRNLYNEEMKRGSDYGFRIGLEEEEEDEDRETDSVREFLRRIWERLTEAVKRFK